MSNELKEALGGLSVILIMLFGIFGVPYVYLGLTGNIIN